MASCVATLVSVDIGILYPLVAFGCLHPLRDTKEMVFHPLAEYLFVLRQCFDQRRYILLLKLLCTWQSLQMPFRGVCIAPVAKQYLLTLHSHCFFA